jgi:hypothetical protein
VVKHYIEWTPKIKPLSEPAGEKLHKPASPPGADQPKHIDCRAIEPFI